MSAIPGYGILKKWSKLLIVDDNYRRIGLYKIKSMRYLHKFGIDSGPASVAEMRGKQYIFPAQTKLESNPISIVGAAIVIFDVET